MNRELKTQSAARTLGCGRTRFCCCSVIALLVRDHILSSTGTTSSLGTYLAVADGQTWILSGV